MNSTLIATFLSVARTKNISRSACELNQVQSTVSKRLRQLEEMVGHPLFDRQKGSKRILLTAEGESFVNLAERWMRLNDELIRLEQPNRPTELKIGGVDSLNLSFMRDVYKTVAAGEPGLRLTVRTYFFREMYAAAAERKIHAGFSFYEQGHISLRVQPLYTEPMVGLRRSGRPGWLDTPVPLADLRLEREIYAPWADAHEIWRKTYLDPAIPPYITIYPVSQILELLETPDQWSIVPQSFAADAVIRKPYCAFEITPSPPPRSCFYLTHKNPTADVARALEIFESHLMPVVETLFGKKRDGNSVWMQEIKTRLAVSA